MRYPMLKPGTRKRVLIDAFRGYEHTPAVSAGAFYEMQNLSGELGPLLSVRRRRTEVEELEDCPTDWVLALGGRGATVVLDASGTLWAGGNCLPRILAGDAEVVAADAQGAPAAMPDPAAVVAVLTVPGSYRFRYNSHFHCWDGPRGIGSLPEEALGTAPRNNGDEITVRYTYTLHTTEARNLVFLGGWVCIFPDGKYANTVKLRQDQPMEEGVDYGQIGQSNLSDNGTAVFEACGPDGTVRTVTWADTAPESGYWVDTTEAEPKVRAWSESQGLWAEVTPYLKCAMPGIAKGVCAGDGVELACRVDRNEADYHLLEQLWSDAHVLTDACHDPGDSGRAEGTNDYVILPGLLPRNFSLSMTPTGRTYFTLTRPLPEMDFVVEAQNRLWGCRCGNGVNELYGSKLGDFRNWSVFEGLSTDSYRVARGNDGPYTGAAVLGGCPLFFRADCLEKLYPSSNGDHGVVTVTLSGIEAGSSASAVVIRDRLYYKSAEGICVYNGTLPVLVSRALGQTHYHSAHAAALGSRYYVSMLDDANASSLFVLDTQTGLWHREDNLYFEAAYTQNNRLYVLPMRCGSLLCLNEATDSRDVIWWAESGDLIPTMGTRRRVTRLQLMTQPELGAELNVFLSYDGGPWLRKGTISGNALQTVTLPIQPRRCSRLRLRLEGVGGMTLHQLTWLTEAAG